MKKKKLKSLGLNKQKISHLHEKNGGLQAPDNQITMSTCSCVTCRPTGCEVQSFIICPPPLTQFCTVECQTRDCTSLLWDATPF